MNTAVLHQNDYKQILAAAEAEVREMFEKYHNEAFVYHDLRHTENVVAAAGKIANHFQIDARDFCIVMTAAWFHDVGYLTDPKNHERTGADKAVKFLRTRQLDEEALKQIEGCVLATRLPQNPETLLEKIICDADLFHLGTGDFIKNNAFLFRELTALKCPNLSEGQFREKTAELFKDHHYQTDYCRLLLNDKKDENLNLILDALDDPEKADRLRPPKKEERTSTNQEKKKKPKKGIETMFRVASNSNQKLSKLADYKARNMITVNSIILSAVISLLLRQLDIYRYLTIPTYMLLLVSVLTLVFAILATRPSLPQGYYDPENLKEKDVNLLFFGNFYKMDLNTYKKSMWSLMDDYDRLYTTLIQDVYYQGVVLGRKYKLLRVSYNIFMYGLVASVLAFIIATMV